MEITVSRDLLAAAVTWAARSLPSRPVVPILAGIRLEAAAGQLSVGVFDYEVSARVTVPAAFLDADGAVLVDGKQLLTAVKSLPKKASRKGALLVTLTRLEDGTVEVACEDALSTVKELPLGEYPALPELPEPSGTLDARSFTQAAARVTVAAGTDETLPVLMCLCMTPDAETLAIAATDRYRFAEDQPQWTAQRAAEPGLRYLVPAVTVADFAKGCTGTVTVAFSDEAHSDGTGGTAAFSDGTRTVTVSTMTGNFPRGYRERFRSSDYATEAVVDSAALTAAVKVCGEMAPGKATLKAVRLTVSDGQLSVEAVRDGATAAHRALPALVTGAPLTAWFHPPYLASMTGAISGPVRLKFTTPARPAEISAAAGPYWAVLVPARVDETAGTAAQ